MGLFSKKHKLSAYEAGKALLLYLEPSKSGEDIYNTAKKQLQEINDLDTHQISFELYCLKIFVVDYMTHNIFGNGDKKNKVLDSFYEGIQEFCEQNDPQWFDEIKKRMTDYSTAIMTYYNDVDANDAKKLGPAYFVGNAFSNCLVNEGDVEIAYIGATCFTGCCISLKEILNSVKII